VNKTFAITWTGSSPGGCALIIKLNFVSSSFAHLDEVVSAPAHGIECKLTRVTIVGMRAHIIGFTLVS
jgi:hypothetical protein